MRAEHGLSRRLHATRRGFLRLAGTSAALTTLAQIRALPAPAAAEPPRERFFDAQETEILTQIAERMVDSGEPGAPAVRETGSVATIDALCRRLDPAQKDASLEAWLTSRLALRRIAFLALRNLAFLGCYSQPETWPLIGYQGPLIERSEKP
jgi:hypothetical protein